MKILVVDDDPAIRRLLVRIFGQDDVKEAEDGLVARKFLTKNATDIVITDLRMPRADGFSVIEAVSELRPGTPTIVLTGQGSLADCVAAVRAGATDFVTKPFEADELKRRVTQAYDDVKNKGASAASGGHPTVELIGGRLEPVLEVVQQIADHDATVLITGESGTGKEVIARLIHNISPRAKGPYQAVNCGAIPENLIESELFGHVKGAFTGAVDDRRGLFVSARGGTVFLDEIGELPLGLQVKLVRVLQEKEVVPIGSATRVPTDVRIVTATLRNLEEMVERGQFREDLYHRVNVIPLHLPPLRKCPSDIDLLAVHFLERACRKYKRTKKLDPGTLIALRAYEWPGNVRELENLIERLVLTCRGSTVTVDNLPAKLLASLPELTLNVSRTAHQELPQNGIDLPRAVEEFERRLIQQALTLAGGNRTRAAELLNINRTTLLSKLKRVAN